MPTPDHRFHISPEWRKVLNYYKGLNEEWKREIYLRNLSAQQRQYLQQLLELDENSPDLENDTNPPISDSHLLDHKQYKRKHFLERLRNRLKIASLAVGFLLVTLAFLNFGSISAWMASIPLLSGIVSSKAPEPDSKNLEVEFQNWVKNFNIEASQAGMDNDTDKDALNNFEEFLLQSSPVEQDLNQNGKIDGLDLLDGLNPATKELINYSDYQIKEKYSQIISRDLLNYRIQALTLQKLPRKTKTEVVQTSNNGDQVVQLPAINQNQVNTEQVGQILIPKTKTNTKLVWSKDVGSADVVNLLGEGVVHYNATTAPGETGVSYFAGVGADFGDRNFATKDLFTNLDQLEPQDLITVIVKLKNGGSKKLIYSVSGTNIYSPADIRQFQSQTDKSELYLSTSWQIAEFDKRLVIKSVLVNQEILAN